MGYFICWIEIVELSWNLKNFNYAMISLISSLHVKNEFTIKSLTVGIPILRPPIKYLTPLFRRNNFCFVSDFNSKSPVDNTPVHIINVDIQDNQEEATIGAFFICDLVNLVWMVQIQFFSIFQDLHESAKNCINFTRIFLIRKLCHLFLIWWIRKSNVFFFPEVPSLFEWNNI